MGSGCYLEKKRERERKGKGRERKERRGGSYECLGIVWLEENKQNMKII